MLNLKKLLTKMLTVTTVNWTPTTGASYSGYGGCWYQTWGRMVHVHVGISGLSANTSSTVYTMPSGLCPRVQIISQGRSANSDSLAYMSMSSGGVIQINPTGAYATGEFFYFI